MTNLPRPAHTDLRPELREFAPPPALPYSDWLGGRRLAEHIVRSEGYAGQSGPYALFDEMEEKDAHLFSALQTRKLGVVARGRNIKPASASETDIAIAQWIERTLAALPGFEAALLQLLDCLGKGLAVAEIIWGFDGEGRTVPQSIKPRAAQRFTWSAADAASSSNDASSAPHAGWRLTDSLYASATATQSSVSPNADAPRPLPARKFLIALFGASDERPYGKGLCERLYWYWWFKKHNIKFWLIYNEKFGAPTVVAQHRQGLSDAERDRLLEVIDAIQTDAGVTVPEGITLELLEAKRSGAGDTYQALAAWCNDEMSRAVLGQTLTSGEGQRSGSLALAQVHETIRQDYLRADAALLMDIVNSQLIRWLIDLNFGTQVPSPRWSIDLSPELDLTREVQVDRQLLQMGVPLSLSYFHEKYGRPAPAAGQPMLQFDDSNLYQYHLQFGILTINEVRAKLGLAPTPWGEKPTSPVDTNQSHQTQSVSTGEDQPENEDKQTLNTETETLKDEDK